MREWFTLSDPGMEEALFDTPMYGEFARIDEFAHPPNESTAFHGEKFHFREYCYEKLSDAVNYARLQASKA